MSFFKKLFSSKKGADKTKAEDSHARFNGIHTTEHFDSRYTEDGIKPEMLDGCLKMIESYFMDNKIERRNATLINHPDNLDQVDQDGFGFVLYCKAFQLGEEQATLFLAYAFSDYLINRYGFKLYRDSKPEYPLRGMTLKYDKNGVVLSLYPYEYASKVLNGGSTFTGLDEKISTQLNELPEVDDVIQKYINPGAEE